MAGKPLNFNTIDTGDGKTYETLSKEFFNEFNKLYKNPDSYAKDLNNDEAKKEA